jgi:hypothetical protein
MSLHLPPAYAYTVYVSGTVAARNHVAAGVPAGANFLVKGLFLSVNVLAVGPVAGQPPMRLYQASGVSGGTLVNNATDVAKFDSHLADSQRTIRIDNPTATLGAPLLMVPSVEAVGGGNNAPSSVQAPPGGSILRAGEFLVLRTDSGDTNQRWAITFFWQELFRV